MFKRSFLLGLVAGLLAGVASLVYQKVYASSLGTDFAGIVKPVSILTASLFMGLLAALLYWALTKWIGNKGEVVFNFLLVILSFAGILFPFAAQLPLDIEMPELFPGLVVPMLFFPALAWFTLKPLFIRSGEQYRKVFG